MKELMWACALLPDETNGEIASLCKRLNKDVRLPETVFRFPLHISLKKSWECDRFFDAQRDVAAFIQSNGRFEIGFDSPVLHKNMIWLPVCVTKKLQEIHDGLDSLLLEKYRVPQDRFDLAFKPHISLFTKGDQKDVMKMFDLLKNEMKPMTTTIRRIVIGGAVHRDTYYDL